MIYNSASSFSTNGHFSHLINNNSASSSQWSLTPGPTRVILHITDKLKKRVDIRVRILSDAEMRVRNLIDKLWPTTYVQTETNDRSISARGFCNVNGGSAVSLVLIICERSSRVIH